MVSKQIGGTRAFEGTEIKVGLRVEHSGPAVRDPTICQMKKLRCLVEKLLQVTLNTLKPGHTDTSGDYPFERGWDGTWGILGVCRVMRCQMVSPGSCLSSSVHLKERPRGCQRGEAPGRKGDHSPIPDLETIEEQLVTARKPAPFLPWPWEEGLLWP